MTARTTSHVVKNVMSVVVTVALAWANTKPSGSTHTSDMPTLRANSRAVNSHTNSVEMMPCGGEADKHNRGTQQGHTHSQLTTAGSQGRKRRKVGMDGQMDMDRHGATHHKQEEAKEVEGADAGYQLGHHQQGPHGRQAHKRNPNVQPHLLVLPEQHTHIHIPQQKP
jgi:hypothetical protein